MSEYFTFHSRENFFVAVANRFMQLISETLTLKPESNILLSGGNTPIALYNTLSDSILRTIDWNRVKFGMMDDRLSASKTSMNSFNLESNLLTRLPKEVLQIIGFNVENHNNNYIKLVESFDYSVDWDIGWFGMGNDGHTAGLFDNAEILHETDLAVVSYSSHENFERVSLKKEVLLKCKKRILLVPSGHRYRILQNSSLNFPIHSIRFDEIYVLLED